MGSREKPKRANDCDEDEYDDADLDADDDDDVDHDDDRFIWMKHAPNGWILQIHTRKTRAVSTLPARCAERIMVMQ